MTDKPEMDVLPDEDPDETPDTPDEDKGAPEEPATVDRAEFTRAVTARDKAKERARVLQAKLDEIEKKDAPDPAAQAEQRAHEKLRKAGARTVLAGMGVTDKAKQTAVLKLVDLSEVDVDSDGDVDEDALAEIFTALGEAFRKAPAAPRGTSARPKGGGRDTDQKLTHDQERYRRIFGPRGKR